MNKLLTALGAALGWPSRSRKQPSNNVQRPNTPVVHTWDRAIESGQYPEGLDVFWLAIDRNGRVAAFATAGEGHIPLSIVRQGELAYQVVDQAFDALTTIGSADLRRDLKLKPNAFETWAEKGVFAYDWANVYSIVAVPTRPINASKLPIPVREALANLVMDADFGEDVGIDAREFFACAESSRW